MTERKATHSDFELLSRTFSVLASELEKTLRSLSVRIYEPGDVILKEGETGSDVYVLVKGAVSIRQSRWLVLSKEVAKLGPGAVFGEIGFLVPAARSASVVAGGPCEAARIVLDDFKELLNSHTELRSRIEEMARRRLYSLSESARS